jgi:23S rRNA pseudouridine1911/1915/1917 synthase
MENKLKILFENENYLVIEKSAGITVNRSDTTSKEITLQDLVEKENKIDKNDTDEDFRNRSGIVHRLDKETSGLLIIAKNAFAFRNLQAQFKERKVSKSYVALVHGEIKPKTGDIDVPVGRLPWNRKRFGVLAGGREAVTHYELISQYWFGNETLSLVRLHPKTGRTHQIRVHLKYIGHPIFADPLYAGRKTSREDRKILTRVFLHAEKIKFSDPATHSEVEFVSGLPPELRGVLEKFEVKKDN